MIWILNKYYYYHRQIEAARLLGRHPVILREEPLGSISRLLSTQEKLKSLVLVRGDRLCAVALRWGQKFVPLKAAERTDMVYGMEAFVRHCEIVDPALLNDAEAAAELLGFEEFLTQIRELEGYVDALMPKRLLPLPDEIRQKAVPGDTYGVFSKSAYWWWHKRTGTLHILGRGSAKTFIVSAKDGHSSEWTLLRPLFMLFIDCFRLRRLIIHEDITDYWGVDMAWASSRYGLDVQPYHESFDNVTWENCSLRWWLNQVFLDKAFTEDQQQAILSHRMDNGPGQDGIWQTYMWPVESWKPGLDRDSFFESRRPASGSEDTEDKVFLLSAREVESYFGEKWARRCAPTAYVLSRGAAWYGNAKPSAVSWWLRSPGYALWNAAVVDVIGELYDGRMVNDRTCVRPAIWVHIDSVFSEGGTITLLKD